MKYFLENIAEIGKETLGNIVAILFWIIIWDMSYPIIEKSTKTTKYTVYLMVITLYLFKTHYLDPELAESHDHNKHVECVKNI